jgi:hypothetical protein
MKSKRQLAREIIELQMPNEGELVKMYKETELVFSVSGDKLKLIKMLEAVKLSMSRNEKLNDLGI